MKISASGSAHNFIFFLIILFIPFLSPAQQSPANDRNVLYDLSGRVIRDAAGNTINYFRSDSKTISGQTEKVRKTPPASPSLSGQTEFDWDWKFSIIGNSIGRRSMQTFDFDQDGKIEILCSADQYGSDFDGDYWYTLEYDAVKQEYRQDYISKNYPVDISRMKLLDITADGTPEIVTCFASGYVIIYTAGKEEIISTQLPTYDEITDVELGDADNDGSPELAFCTENNIILCSPSTLAVELVIDQGATEICVGNVDADNSIEIVTTKGKVLYCTNSGVVTEWTFGDISYDYGLMVEMADLDGDTMQEIILAKSWAAIDVYDADLKALKYEIETDQDIQALRIQDLNNDNHPEIIYGDGQWGDIHCINPVDQGEMWYVHNPDHGITAISIADVDNDGVQEVMWGAGWSSTGADYLYVAGLDTKAIEWQSLPIDGPIYALAADDVDNDGDTELVAVSYESESGYGSGILLIFDAQTHELEWHGDGEYFYQIWTGIYDVAVANVDSDPQKEIIIAAGRTYTGEIWIVDGLTKTIEKSHIYNSEDLPEFYSLDVNDIDSDGQQEIIAANDQNYYIISTADLSIEYTSGPLSYYSQMNVKTGNINSTAEQEIVMISGMKIHVFGGISHTHWTSTQYGYSCFDLQDYTGDGIPEIIAGYSDGTIEVIEGETFATILIFRKIGTSIQNVTIADLGGTSVPEFIYTSRGRVFIFFADDQNTYSQQFDRLAGDYNGLMIRDLDGDGNDEIYLGTSSSIFRLGHDAYKCMWLRVQKSFSNRSCIGTNDGEINVSGTDGTAPYSYLWNNGSTQSHLTSLATGTYIVTITDGEGCTAKDTTEIKQARLVAEYESTDVSCSPGHDGTALVTIIEGVAPYTYTWSNGGATQIIGGLEPGSYSVTVTDALSCTSSGILSVSQEELYYGYTTSEPECYGFNDGEITLSPYGTAPYSYLWSTGQTTKSLYNLGPGTYSATITDAHNCVATAEITFDVPPQILSYTTSTPDDPLTIFGEGTATINVVGGHPPYDIEWNDPFQQNTVTAVNLSSGLYAVAIRDMNGCYHFDQAFVTYVNALPEKDEAADIHIFPNPSEGLIRIELTANYQTITAIQVIDETGRRVYSAPAEAPVVNGYSVDLSFLSPGIYQLFLELDHHIIKSARLVIR